MRASLDPDRRWASVARRSSVVGATLFGGLALFEAALAAGLPWGAAAWGGTHSQLGLGLRLASAGAAVVLPAAALVVLRKAGHQVWSPLPDRWVPAAAWVLAGYSTLGVLANAASRSTVERAVMTPVALTLAVSCLIVATRGVAAQRPGVACE